MTIEKIYTPQDDAFYAVITHAAGPQGALPLTPQMLMESPSGNLFGMTQNAGMGWDANKLTGKEVLIIGTQGGIRAGDGRPVALGYHTGHWEIGMQMQAAAKEITRNGGIPFAAFVSDPCDGRSQGTHGMFDSLPYRNDAAIVFRRLIRSLPTRRAVIGVATCDKGLPATMIALASMHDLPTILVPGGATLPPTVGEDAGKVQTIGARFANHELSLQEAAELGCRACASPGGGCQFLGTAGTPPGGGERRGGGGPPPPLPGGAVRRCRPSRSWDLANSSLASALRVEISSARQNEAMISASLSLPLAPWQPSICRHSAWSGSVVPPPTVPITSAGSVMLQ